VPLVAAAVCPCPPLIVPEVAAGAAAELDDLRAACDDVIGRLLAARPDGILIIGTGPETAWRPADEYGSLAPWGVPLEIVSGGRERPGLPLSLTLGAWLLGRSRAGSVRVGLARVAATEPAAGCAAFGRDRCAPWLPRVAMLVMADGSACRGVPSPGYGDARAEPFDAEVTRALADADPAGLLGLDIPLAERLMVGGRPAWQVLAGATSGTSWRGEVLYDAAPYGVNYTVAAWRPAEVAG
jgi:hypothetical protein